MDIFIIGVVGFIGHATAMRLLRDGHTVYGIDKPRDLRADKGPRLDELERQEMFNLVHADLANYDEARAAIINLPFDVMIHLAGQYSVGYSSKNLQAFIDGNLRSYLHVMDIAREKGIKRVIYASSTFVQTN